MAAQLTSSLQQRNTLKQLIGTISYEVMPFKSVKEQVLANVPVEVPLTVTATGGKGLEPTLETSVFLRQQGYAVTPHVPARLVSGHQELDALVSRLEAAGVDHIFIVGGDAEEPAGEFTDSLGLLQSLDARGHHFKKIGIGGYPEGHAVIPQEAMDQALRDKAPYADRVLTQICFDPDAIIRWGSRIREEGVGLPISAGMPGPVSRQKLMRISAGLGVGQSANFLKKQQNMFWKFFSPSGYKPTKLIRGLVENLSRQQVPVISGFHIYTFNDLANTEAWRRELIAEVQ